MSLFKSVTLAWVLAFVTGWSAGLAAPVNDLYSQPLAVPSQTSVDFSGTTSGSTREPGEPVTWDGVDYSVWWTWVAPESGRFTLFTTNTLVDTVLVVGEDNDDLFSFTPIAIHDDINFDADLLTSRVTFRAEAGVTYRFGLLSYNSGPVALRLRSAPPGPVNDDWADASEITGALPITVTGSNRNALDEPFEPDHAGEPPQSSVWWRWVATVTTNVIVTTSGSNFDTILAVYSGGSLPELSELASNDDVATGNHTSRLNFPAVAGQTYYIAVEGYDGEVGNIQLKLSSGPLPKAPTWSLPTVDGEWVSSSAFLGKVVILDFWATWCGPCVAELPGFMALQDRYGPERFTMIGVSTDNDVNYVRTVADFIADKGMNYPVVLATGTDLTERYGGIPAIPTTFVLNHRGEIAFKHIGYTESEIFENQILGLLAAMDAAVELPKTTAELVGGMVHVSWPDTGVSFLVEVTDSPDGTWSPWDGTVGTADNRRHMDLPLNAQARFVRLRRAP